MDAVLQPRGLNRRRNGAAGALAAALLAATACGSLKSCAVDGPPAPDGQYLYVAHDAADAIAPGADPQIAALRIDPATGTLAAVAGSPTAARAVGAFALAHDPTGRWFSLAGSQLGLLALSAGGGLASPRGLRTGGLAAAFDAAGRFFFVTTGSGLQVYPFDARTGVDASRPLHAEPAPPFLFHLATSADGGLLVAAGDDTLASFTIDRESGRLTRAPGSPVSLPLRALDLALHPSGRFVFVRGEAGARERLAAYRLEAAGSIVPLDGSPFALGADTRAIALSPDGAFLFVLDRDRRSIQSFALDAAGRPHLASSMHVDDDGGGTGTLVPDAAGRYLYFASAARHQVLGFAIDASRGSLSPLPGSPFTVGGKITDLATTPLPDEPVKLAALPDLPDGGGDLTAGMPRFDRQSAVPADATVAELVAALADSSETARLFAIDALGRRTDAGPAVPALVGALDDAASSVRLAAASVLTAWARRHPGAVDVAVLGRIANSGPGRIDAITNALAVLALRGPEAAPHLARALGRHDGDLRDGAYEALLAMGPDARGAVGELTGLLQSSRANWRAAHVLGAIGPDASPAVPELYGLLRHPTPWVARAARDALVRIRGAAD